MFADLHIHSQYSDGALTVEEIISKAKVQNITLISICDHETIDAYLNLDDSCVDENIKIISGVEITSIFENVEYDILGYGFDVRNKPLNDLLRYNREIYIDRGIKLIEKMSADYKCISVHEFLEYERNRKNGGWESIDYLKSKNIVNNVSDFFTLANKYNTPLERNFLCASEVIKIIHDANGYAVLAHLGVTTKQDLTICKKIINDFLYMNIDGFECYYPAHSDKITKLLIEFCKEHDLIITASSDEHGGFNGEDFYIGGVKIETTQLNLKGLLY